MSSWLRSAPATAVPLDTRKTRTSLALEQFVPLVTAMEHPSVLDLGRVWQATVEFFTSAGCKLYSEDLFETLHKVQSATKADAPPVEERFFAGALRYPEQHFRGILAWDLFDFLPEEVVRPLATRLYALLEEGGALMLLCHERPEGVSLRRYRVLNEHTLELLPGSLPLVARRSYTNRALLELFAPFSTTRNFVGRDHLRELFLVK